jgi:hypothetical protein
MLSIRYYCQILTKLESCRQIFEKHSHITFHENPSGGEPSCCMKAGGWTDRHDEVNDRVSQFYECA